MQNTRIERADQAARIAEALAKAGIISDAPDEIPNPFWAAQEAFYICQGQRNGRAWLELKEWLTGPAFPRSEYYRKMAEYCHRALRRHDLCDELREAVGYAWGYNAALADAHRRVASGAEGPEPPDG